ncbi:DUF1638 domain-containing protein [Porticoccaceae bacterium]|jgi:hypothetical protein|nr:DUF1638 domain-containing protein [Porticoccaceae bacterium]MDA9583714.1 DUF1638 domain-containing protein [Porticoccaceae bacterium]MDB2400849.1 DUF1638 domain-containing protein [Porticoccaceae bacterium]MDB2558598.1 DUF1638 domain-containing protein [Porticoccaceae bacterium]MDC0053100.1 DUF1638 domain-containing protein [Gammaproteobacteria bacterium]
MSTARDPAAQSSPILIIACGALAQEIVQLQTLNGWNHLHLKCLDAELHNRPHLIAGKLREKIAQHRNEYNNIFVAYADCGSGGEIDRVLEDENIERLPGAHCYSFFAGEQRFKEISEQELGSFYLTDFLAKHFERLVIKGLKLDQHPELRDQYFGSYTRVVYLSQEDNPSVRSLAKNAALFLGLDFEHEHCGYGDLQTGLESQVLKFG